MRQRDLLDRLQELLEREGVGALDELEVKERDPEWNLKTSCLTGGEVRELEEAQKAMAVEYRRVFNVAKGEEDMFVMQRPLRMRHDWVAIAEGRATSEVDQPVRHSWDRFLTGAKERAQHV